MYKVFSNKLKVQVGRRGAVSQRSKSHLQKFMSAKNVQVSQNQLILSKTAFGRYFYLILSCIVGKGAAQQQQSFVRHSVVSYKSLWFLSLSYFKLAYLVQVLYILFTQCFLLFVLLNQGNCSTVCSCFLRWGRFPVISGTCYKQHTTVRQMFLSDLLTLL